MQGSVPIDRIDVCSTKTVETDMKICAGDDVNMIQTCQVIQKTFFFNIKQYLSIFTTNNLFLFNFLNFL